VLSPMFISEVAEDSIRGTLASGLFTLLHHQSINAHTAGAQAFLMDHTYAEWAITTRAQCVFVGANGCKFSRD
jgi:hypothetical protein